TDRMLAARRQRRFPPHGRCASPLRLPKRVDHLNARSGAQVTFESMPASLVAWYRWRMTVTIGRQELLAALGGAAVSWPLTARAQQPVFCRQHCAERAGARGRGGWRRGFTEGCATHVGRLMRECRVSLSLTRGRMS